MPSNIDTLVTVFGGSGFIGRHTIRALAKRDYRIRVAVRRPDLTGHLQPLGRVGQIMPVQANVRYPDSVAAATNGADIVVNLVGILAEGGAQTFNAVQAEGAATIAQAAASQNARFVHVSALGADENSSSDYARTKAAGEKAAFAAVPSATVLRPSIVFGPEDQFTNRFAGMADFPILPVIAPRTRFQPVFVRDVARAIAESALDPKAHGGKTYELAGPEQLTMRELNERVAAMAGCHPDLVEVPDFVASAVSYLGFLPGAPLSRDQWLMLQHDNVASGKQPGFKAFNMEPTPLAAAAPEWLGRFRKGGRFRPSAAA